MRRKVIRLVYEYGKGLITREEYIDRLTSFKAQAVTNQVEANHTVNLINTLLKSNTETKNLTN